ncbi:Glycosyltransferase involved in cell wall bisynthesis [Halpernia humi]|uniref:Glycosyltransferase involved in cell wall bisynthesis n=1 Tax=Halpernia humi TaxID=493375 RepID=A0A1H6AP48_9FLAO|nr:glycosyltransferase [Halpernia humi]SEG50172.1 Glycosyltransferase involved in cell wall bisynthesis [Halpernia humi]
MNKYPKISACIVTYNQEDLISQCLDGVLIQDYPGEIEIVLSDDCSTDNTDAVITDYIATKKIPENITVKYISQQINKGYVRNLMFVLSDATGDYIALCDGDDYWTSVDKLRKQCDFLEKNPDYSLCYTSYQCIDLKGNKLGVARSGLNKKNTADEVLQGRFLLPIRTAFSRNFSNEFVPFFEKFLNPTSADRIYPYFYALKGKVKFFDEITAVYRVHEGGIWTRLDERRKIEESIKHQMIFIERATDNELKKNSAKKIFFRDTLSSLYFKFVKDPSNIFGNIIFVVKKNKIAKSQLLPAALDFFKYYLQILKSKFK